MERISLCSTLLAIGLLGFAQTLLAQPQTAEQKPKHAMGAGFAQTLLAEPQTAEQKLKNAMSAGPPSVAKDATILDRVDVAKAKVLRRGRTDGRAFQTILARRETTPNVWIRMGWSGGRH